MTDLFDADGRLKYGQSQELHEYGLANGHPPIADKLAMIDFDATIVEWGALMGPKKFTPGAVDAMWLLIQKGYRIGIFTSRMSRAWAQSVVGYDDDDVVEFLAEQHKYVENILDLANIPYAFITAEKVPAQFYIDDKAIGFRGNWQEVLSDSLVK